jgi:hypothetical protein
VPSLYIHLARLDPIPSLHITFIPPPPPLSFLSSTSSMPSLARTRLFRDVILVLLGAFSTHFYTALFQPLEDLTSILVETPTHFGSQRFVQDAGVIDPHGDAHQDKTIDSVRHVQYALLDAVPPPVHPGASTTTMTTAQPSAATPLVDVSTTIPETVIVEHVPGWTVFKNLYMSNGTLFVVSSKPRTDFPELQYLTSTGLEAKNTPENIVARMPTARDMDFISVEEAKSLWGSETSRNRIRSLYGNSVSSDLLGVVNHHISDVDPVPLQWLFNDPPQCS